MKQTLVGTKDCQPGRHELPLSTYFSSVYVDISVGQTEVKLCYDISCEGLLWGRGCSYITSMLPQQPGSAKKYFAEALACCYFIGVTVE